MEVDRIDISMEEEVVESAVATAASSSKRGAGPQLRCPICSSVMSEAELDAHLDRCGVAAGSQLRSSAGSSSSSQPAARHSGHAEEPVVTVLCDGCRSSRQPASAMLDCTDGHLLCAACIAAAAPDAAGCLLSGCKGRLTDFSRLRRAVSRGDQAALLQQWRPGSEAVQAVMAAPRPCIGCGSASRRASATPRLLDAERLQGLVADCLQLKTHEGCTVDVLSQCKHKGCGVSVCVLCNARSTAGIDSEEHVLAVLQLLLTLLQQAATKEPTERRGRRAARGRSHAGSGAEATAEAGTGSRKRRGVGYGGAVNAKAPNINGKRERLRQHQDASDQRVTACLQLLYQLLHGNQHLLLRQAATARTLSVLLHGGLIPVLLLFLRNDSILDLSERYSMYWQLLRLVQLLARPDLALSCLLVLNPDEDSACSVERLLSGLGQQGHFFVSSQSRDQIGEEETLALSLCADINTTAADVRNAVQHLLLPLQAEQEEKKGEEGKDEAEQLHSALQSLKFGTAALASEPSYALRSFLQAGGSKGRECISRIRKEWATLASGSSIPDDIYVRIDESRMDVLRFLVVGGAGTPYHNGAFLFDVFIPDSYPQAPPKLQFITTGQGSWRAGPNLYNTGQAGSSLTQANRWPEAAAGAAGS